MANSLSINDFIQELRDNFSKRISRQTGWGKNQLMEQFNLALVDVSSNHIGADILFRPTNPSSNESYDYFISYLTDTGRNKWVIESLPRSMSARDLLRLQRQLMADQIVGVALLGPTKNTPY